MNPVEVDVLLLAAGLGTRLQPLTFNCPKPLLQVAGRPLIDRSLELISRAGLRRVIINLHYLPQLLQEYVGLGEKWGLEVEYSFEPTLLDTGGAIKNIEGRLRHSHLLTLNSDTLFGSDFDLRALLIAHLEDLPETYVTAVVRADPDAEQFGVLEVDDEGYLLRFRGISRAGDGGPGEKVMFAGCQVLRREVLDFMPPAGNVFSSTRDTWVKLLGNGCAIRTFRYEGFWSDVGTPERLQWASAALAMNASD